MYAKVVDNKLQIAPSNYVKGDKLIINFDKNIELMTQEGFKEVKEVMPLIDEETQELRVASINELEDIIEVFYEVITK